MWGGFQARWCSFFNDRSSNKIRKGRYKIEHCFLIGILPPGAWYCWCCLLRFSVSSFGVNRTINISWAPMYSSDQTKHKCVLSMVRACSKRQSKLCASSRYWLILAARVTWCEGCCNRQFYRHFFQNFSLCKPERYDTSTYLPVFNNISTW